MRKSILLLTLLLIPGLLRAQSAQVAIFPLKDVRPGMTGVGRTIFQGDRVQEFKVDILGVIPNMGPRQAVILARLSGGPLAETGVLEGMSGSPVYIDGKLLGAVALGFPFSKQALAGITPIEEMIRQEQVAEAETRAQSQRDAALQSVARSGRFQIVSSPERLLARGDQVDAPASDMAGLSLPEIHTPLVLSGFDPRAVRHFLPQFQSLGLVPMLGGGGGSLSLKSMKMGNPASLRPGDMISVQLMRGDLGVSADGTVTYIHGQQIYAFGHRFLAAGATAMPFAKARVVALMAGLMTSFKISVPGAQMGVIRQDRSQGVYGTLGGHAAMIPVRVHIHTVGDQARTYSFEMVNHPFLTPFLFNMAIYSTLDATQRGLGPETIQLNGAIHLQNAPAVKLNGIFAGDMNGPAMAAIAVSRPLAYLYSSGLSGIQIRGIDLDVRSTEHKQLLTLQQVWSDHRQVEPGELVHLTAILRAADGTEVAHTMAVRLPGTLTPGPVSVLVGDGSSVDPSGSLAAQAGDTVRNLAELVHDINRLRRDNEIYVRVQSNSPGFRMGAAQFPFPPPSLMRALSADPAVGTDITATPASVVVESHSEALPFVIQGLKTITLTVKDR